VTVAQHLRRHALSLNAVRLCLGLLVLVSHSWPLGGWGADPDWLTLRPSLNMGGFAVGAFFALSGMLVTMSGWRNTPVSYVIARALRICPAYLVVLVLSATALAPGVYWATHGSLVDYVRLGPGGPVQYVLHNAWFPPRLQFGIDDVFATTTPYGRELGNTSVINGSIWTLPLEVGCYVVALVAVIVGRRFGAVRSSATFLALAAATILLTHDRQEAELLFVFMTGALLGTLSERVTLSRRLVMTALIIYLVTSLTGGVLFRTLGLATLCVLLPALAGTFRAPAVFRNDLSYGTYIWAFPIQQTLAFAGLSAYRLLYVSTATALTLVMAGLSWRWIEKPALAVKERRRAGRPRQPREAEPRTT
jgi:peptidoglycan/LPS O-acetylase OafA/YrhL